MKYRKYRLAKKILAARDAYNFVFEPVEGEVPEYKAGQFFNIKISKMADKHNFRQYSALHIHNKKELGFGIKICGRFTGELNKLEIGDEVEIDGPYGIFSADKCGGEEIVFIAGGIGITPFLCMSEHLAKINYSGRWNLFYSCRNAEDVAFKGEIDALCSQNENFNVVYTLTGAEVLAVWKGERGRLSVERIRKHVPKLENAQIYMCAAKEFVDSMRSMLLENGVKAQNIHVEKW